MCGGAGGIKGGKKREEVRAGGRTVAFLSTGQVFDAVPAAKAAAAAPVGAAFGLTAEDVGSELFG